MHGHGTKKGFWFYLWEIHWSQNEVVFRAPILELWGLFRVQHHGIETNPFCLPSPAILHCTCHTATSAIFLKCKSDYVTHAKKSLMDPYDLLGKIRSLGHDLWAFHSVASLCPQATSVPTDFQLIHDDLFAVLWLCQVLSPLFPFYILIFQLEKNKQNIVINAWYFTSRDGPLFHLV